MESPLESYLPAGEVPLLKSRRNFCRLDGGSWLAIGFVFGAKQTHGYLLDHYLVRALVDPADSSIDQVSGSSRLEAVAAGAKYLHRPDRCTKCSVPREVL